MPQRIWVTVKPQSRKQEVTRLVNGEYHVSVHAPARDGKANEAVVEALADYFTRPKSAIKIVRGASARRKLIEID